MKKTFKIVLLLLVPVVILAILILYLTNNKSDSLPSTADKIPQEETEKPVKQKKAETKTKINWIALPAPPETKDKSKPNIPVDSKGRIKPHIIKSENEVRYLVNNLEKSPIYPKIIKSFYFLRNIKGQWDKKKAIGLIDARMKTFQAGESKLWFQLAGIDAYARRCVREVPNSSMSYAYIFKYSDKLANIDLELFYRLITEMTKITSRRNVRQQSLVNNMQGILLELLPTYLLIKKLSSGEPTMPYAVNGKALEQLLKKMDKSNGNNFNYLYRCALLPLPIKELDSRVSKVINHPEFASQPAKIKCQLYKYLEHRNENFGFKEHFKWASKAMENGAGYSKILNIYYDYLTQATLTDELKYLERQFSDISQKPNKKIKKLPKGASDLSSGLIISRRSVKEQKILKEVEKLYAANGPKKYQELQVNLQKKYHGSSLALQYLRLLYLRDTVKSKRKNLIRLHEKSFNKLLAKALTDYTCPDDAVNMFYFIRDKLKKEGKAYKYLEAYSNNIADPSQVKLRIVYMLAKRFAKKDKAKALAIINKVNLSKYDISSGGALAFRVRMLSGFKKRLQKAEKVN